MTKHYKGLIDRYRDRLPVSAETPVISLCEGDTPLIELLHLPSYDHGCQQSCRAGG